MPTRLRPVLAGSLAAALVAAGCGPAPESESSAASGLTREQYIERADVICNRMLAEGRSLRGRPRAEQLEQVLAIQARMIRRLRALEPPRGDEQRVRDVLRHLDRLQAAAVMLARTEGEEVLGATAAIAVETDAVDQASRRYGLFPRCRAFRVSPKLHALIHAPRPKPKPPAPAPGRAQASDLDAAARALIPERRRVVAQENCAGGGRGFCVTISLEPIPTPVGSRRAAFLRRALRNGWQEITPDEGPSAGVLLLRRGDDEAVVWIMSPGCREGTGDGPAPTPRRCVDTIMVHGRF